MMTFHDLKVGQQFRFQSEETMPYSGIEHGPWIKVSARKYEKVLGSGRPMQCRIGSVNVAVKLDPSTR